MREIKICCDWMKDNIEVFDIAKDGSISISTCEDHWFRLENIKFCPFCGEKLELIK